MDVLQAIKELTGKDWNLHGRLEYWDLQGSVLEQADDGTERVKPPTVEELQAHIENDPLKYKELRSTEYPLLEDQLDAIWKGEPYTSEMKDIILAIKQKYPKLEGK